LDQVLETGGVLIGESMAVEIEALGGGVMKAP
jgi:hypothetical protein